MTTNTPRKKAGRKAKVHTPGVFLRSFKKKRADGSVFEYFGEIWQICYSAPDPITGKPKMIFESSRSKSKTIAEKLLAQRKAEVLAKTHPHAVPKSDQTLKDYIDDVYLKEDEVLALSGLDKKKLVLNSIKENIGRYKINQITADVVKNYIKLKTTQRAEVLKDQAKKRAEKAQQLALKSGVPLVDVVDYVDKPLSVATKNRHIATIKTVMAHAYENKVITEKTMAEIKGLNKTKENNSRIRYITLTEIPKLLQACNEHMIDLRQIVEFALTTGLRKGRVYRLEWRMIDIEHKFLHIPKDKHGERFDAPLGTGAMRVLTERWAVKSDDSPYVFYNPSNNDRWYDLKDGFNKAVKSAGITDFHFHDLRHTFISHLVMADVQLAKVQSLAGHKTLEMTLRYAHLSPQTLVAAIEKLPY